MPRKKITARRFDWQPMEPERRQPRKRQPVPEIVVRNQPMPEIAVRNQPMPEIVVRNQPMPEIVVRNQPVREIALRKQPVQEIAARKQPQPVRKIIVPRRRQVARKTGVRKQPMGEVAINRESVRKFAPISVKLEETSKEGLDKFLRVAFEEELDVERLRQGPPVDQSSIFDAYYGSNKHRDHVWTDHLVYKLYRDADMEKVIDEKFINKRELKRLYGLDYIDDDPEDHFYLKKISDQMGYGLFARHTIPAGTIIGQYTGELISMQEYDKRLKKVRKEGGRNYFFATCLNRVIDAGAMGNHTRFINHGCGDLMNCGIEFVADENHHIPSNIVISSREIKADEELLLNYTKDYFVDMDCLCGSNNCVNYEDKIVELDD